jgi:hypothetical protein
VQALILRLYHAILFVIPEVATILLLVLAGGSFTSGPARSSAPARARVRERHNDP